MEQYVNKNFLNRYDDFKLFVKEIANDGYEQNFKTPKHVLEWADIFQEKKKIALMSARLHLKSTTIYHYILWLMLMNMDKDLEVLYLSYKKPMAEYHLKKVKKLISSHPLFKEFKDLTPAESILRYSVDGKHQIVVEPEGILSFTRGRHPDIVICDDILADPSQALNLTVIDKIKRIFDEDISSLPKIGGQLILIGTPQHLEDLFFQIKKRSIDKTTDFFYKEYPALTNEKPLWPEVFPLEVLQRKRQENEKSFNKEFMCSPVWSEEAYLKNTMISQVMQLPKNLEGVTENIPVFAGLDIGKVSHPSHLSIFALDKGNYFQVYQKFMDQWDYLRQVEFINNLIKSFQLRRIYYDDTRSELEGFKEAKIIDRGIWKGVKFTYKEKFEIAGNFQRLVSSDRIKLIKDERQRRSILSVNNDLDALETPEGHGDAFWSIALALKYKPSGGPITIVGGGVRS